MSVVCGPNATLCISSVRHHDLVERPFSRLSQESSIKVLSSTLIVATYFCLINCLRNVNIHTFDHSLFFLIFLGCTSPLLFVLFHCSGCCLTVHFLPLLSNRVFYIVMNWHFPWQIVKLSLSNNCKTILRSVRPVFDSPVPNKHHNSQWKVC